jgi:hypothetical protein
MKKIIDNVAYDTDRCELVAMRRQSSTSYEYLLRTQSGQLLLADSSQSTCLGRSVCCGDVVITAAGARRSVSGTSSAGYCLLSGDPDKKIPCASVAACHVPYIHLRLFAKGESCDGFIIDDAHVEDRLKQLGLIKDMDEVRE